MSDPLPCGEGLGVGVAVVDDLVQQQLPPSPTLPHKGGGSGPSCGILCLNFAGTCSSQTGVSRICSSTARPSRP